MNYYNFSKINKLPRLYLRQIVCSSLKEDIGKRDIATEMAIPKAQWAKAVLLAKEDCVVCGLDIASIIFKAKDKKIQFKPLFKDGQYVKKGQILAQIKARARSILTAERVALNFLSLLSGIATKTKEYVDKVEPYRVKIMDTRKTIPGLRGLQKYAVRMGGGVNHRMKLDEMILVKDNHLAALCAMRHASCVKDIIKTIKEKKPKDVKIEIEVKNLREFKEAMKLEPDVIMLDNMSIGDMKKAVQLNNNLRTREPENSRTKLEASGGITLKNVKKVAATGVDMISIGELTHSLNSTDISLEVL